MQKARRVRRAPPQRVHRRLGAGQRVGEQGQHARPEPMLRAVVAHPRHELTAHVGHDSRDTHALLAQPAMPGHLNRRRPLRMDLHRRPHPKRVNRRGGGDPENAVERLRRKRDLPRRHVIAAEGFQRHAPLPGHRRPSCRTPATGPTGTTIRPSMNVRIGRGQHALRLGANPRGVSIESHAVAALDGIRPLPRPVRAHRFVGPSR